MLKRRKTAKRFFWMLATLFIFLNAVAAFHAWKFTHFTQEASAVRANSLQLSAAEKLETAILGMDNPKPVAAHLPTQPFEKLTLEGPKQLEAWLLKSDSAVGTVILFHGYKNEKSSQLDRAEELLKMDYNTLLVDFRGSGGSEGYTTTIGYEEAEDVQTAFDFVKNSGEKNIVLLGVSMGAAAVMKAVSDGLVQPRAVILECPFGRMYDAVCVRFRMMGAPTFPLAGLLTFWGGVEHGFWAFSHNPVDYAKNMRLPVLLLYGEQDDRVGRAETEDIFAHLPVKKELKTYPLAGHESYLNRYRVEWRADVREFLRDIS